MLSNSFQAELTNHFSAPSSLQSVVSSQAVFTSFWVQAFSASNAIDAVMLYLAEKLLFLTASLEGSPGREVHVVPGVFLSLLWQ